MLSPLKKVFFQLHVQCVCYHSGDYRTEILVLSINVVLHVVQIHSNISIYYFVVHHVRILDKTLSMARTQVLRFHLLGMRRICRIGRSESLGGYGDRKVLEVRKVEKFDSLGRTEILGG
jgi:hypothetical protein